MSYKCSKCNSVEIKVRKTYPHGKKSKAVVARSCAVCGSTSVEEVRNFGRRR